MSFTLKVQFTGLCLHVVHKTEKAVAVLMPDGRFRGSPKRHPDFTRAVPHAGYIRVDLAYVAGASKYAQLPDGERPSNTLGTFDGPFFETVYRIGRLQDPLGGGQTLDFGLPVDDAEHKVETKLPKLDQVAPEIPLRADLFTKLAGAIPATETARATPSPLLFRTLLRGGTLEAVQGAAPEDWSIDVRLNLEKPKLPIVAPFAGEVLWTREVEGRNELTLTLTDFDGSNPVKLSLVPVNGEIKLKIANLCSENALEWDEYPLRTPAMEDSDYKWFYHLLEPPDINPPTPDLLTRWTRLLKGRLLPAPRLVTQSPELMGGHPPFDCAGTEKSFSFPAFETWSTT